MDKYVKAEMEVIEFEAEDVITTSTITECVPEAQVCAGVELG